MSKEVEGGRWIGERVKCLGGDENVEVVVKGMKNDKRGER